MKTIKSFMMALFGLLALTACSSDDDPSPASEAQMQAINGHWYAAAPISGETDNWRTEEEGDMTTYNSIGALIYLNGVNTDASMWGYTYLQDGDLVNYDGMFKRSDDARFDFTMDSDGYIKTTSNLTDAPQVSNMHYDSTKDVITADVTYKGHPLSLTFTRRSSFDAEPTLKELWDILVESGEVGGYEDNNNELNTDIYSDDATESSRANQSTFDN